MCGGLWSRECRARFGLRRCRGSGRVVWKVSWEGKRLVVEERGD